MKFIFKWNNLKLLKFVKLFRISRKLNQLGLLNSNEVVKTQMMLNDHRKNS